MKRCNRNEKRESKNKKGGPGINIKAGRGGDKVIYLERKLRVYLRQEKTFT